MALDEPETLPLLQQDTEPRSGRRDEKRGLHGGGGDLVALSALRVRFDRPAPGAARRNRSRGRARVATGKAPSGG